MHLIEVFTENPILGPGTYLAEDVNAGEFLSRGWCNVLGCPPLVLAREETEFKAFDPEKDWNGEKLLFVRPGGFGDLLFLTPTFRELRKRWPAIAIYVACFDRFKDALSHNSDIDGFERYPVEINRWKGYDAHVWLENVLELNPSEREKHAVDVIADRLQLEFEDKTMRYVVTPTELSRAQLECPRWPDRPVRVGVQMTASGSCRTYPMIGDVATRLWRDHGHEVYLFGRPNEIVTDQPEGLVNVMMRAKNFRESCAILSTCDVVVAPDSALAHVAGALGIPCVALFGPFPWKTRTAYAEKTFALQGVCPVSPCFHHARGGAGAFPDLGPCSRTGKCEALAGIPVDRVLREVEKRLEQHGKTVTS